MTPSATSTLVRLRGVLDVVGTTEGENLPELLTEVARAVCESLGYRTAVVNLYRPATDELEIAAVHGSAEVRSFLLGDRRPREAWTPLLDERFARAGGAYFVPHGEYDWMADGVKSFVPRLEVSGDPDAWDAEDALFVPMTAADGALLGILSVDEPLSGRIPTDAELELLGAFASHAALAVQIAQRAAEARRHRTALTHLLEVSSQLTQTDSIDQMLHAVCEGIADALGFGRVSVELLEPDERLHVHASVGWEGEQSAPVALATVAPLIVPAHEVEGCYLLTSEQAAERVPGVRVGYRSRRNGSGPRAWSHHWLFVPLRNRAGDLRGLIWVDDPEDCLVPSRERLQALRTFANQAAAALETASDVAALREATGSRAALLHSAPVATVVVDEREIVLLWNAQAERLFGWTAEETLGRPNPLVGPANVAESDRLRQAVLAGVTHSALAVSRAGKDGRRLDLELSTASVRSADGVRIVAMYADVTERRRAEEEARRAAARFELAAVATGSAVYEWNRHSRTRRWTEGLTHVFGYPSGPEAKSDEWWLERIHPDDRPAVESSYARHLDALGPYTNRYRWRAADGTYRHVLEQAVVLADEAGPRAIGAMMDVTERVRLEEDLHQSQKLDAIGRLAGGVAHDFNNLLTAITGYGELALSKVERGADPTREISETLRSAERAAGLTRQLLAFGRKQIMQPRVVDLNEVVGGLEELLRRLIGEDVELETRLAAVLDAVEVDPGQVEQIVVNLAVNARDAMPGGGRLVVETANVEVGDREWENLAAGPYVRLSVTDTGVGMDDETRARIFEPFFTTKEAGRGTGLGLATVYGIVRQSGGAIRTASAPDAGTRFEIVFPRVEATSPVAPVAELEPARAPAATVLLVEDEEVVRTLVREILESRGFEVLEAANPAEALDIASERTAPIDVLLTDVVMPRMSGRELAQRFAALHPEARLLYMSGYTDGAIVQHGVLAEGTMFLQKPFTMDSLVAKIAEVLELEAA